VIKSDHMIILILVPPITIGGVFFLLMVRRSIRIGYDLGIITEKSTARPFDGRLGGVLMEVMGLIKTDRHLEASSHFRRGRLYAKAFYGSLFLYGAAVLATGIWLNS